MTAPIRQLVSRVGNQGLVLAEINEPKKEVKLIDSDLKWEMENRGVDNKMAGSQIKFGEPGFFEAFMQYCKKNNRYELINKNIKPRPSQGNVPRP